MVLLIGSVSILVFLSTLIILKSKIKSVRVKEQQIGWLTSKDIIWDEELNKNFWERIVVPVVKRLSSQLNKASKRKQKNRLKKKTTESRLNNDLRLAGIHMDANEFMFLRMIITVAILLFGIIGSMQVTNEIEMQFLIILFASVLAIAAPMFYLRSRVKNRQLAIQNQMPNVMDILSVSIEAGLGFDAALLKVMERLDGPLIDELALVYREIQMGVSRRESLSALGKRSNVPELQTFASAVIQSDQYGTPIKNVLRQQAVQLRVSRKQAAKEKGMKAPVRMLLPMVIFLFPVIFIILLGPTIITTLNQFS